MSADPVLERYGDKLPASRELRFYTPREIATMTGDEPDWVIRGFVAHMAITELTGKVKRAGKTTLILAAVRALLDGLPFLGYATTATRVVYLTEQTPGTFREALQTADLLDRDGELLILFRRDFAGMPWADVVEIAVARCAESGAGLLVIDTIAKLSAIAQENDASEWARALEPLQDAAHDGLAIIVARHDRKSGGEVGDSGRGSSAGSGDVDIILQLRRPEGNQPTNRRVIEALSRYQLTPEKIIVELRDEGFVLLGSEEAVSAADAERFCFLSLGERFDRKESEGLTRDELVVLGQDADPAISEPSIRRALGRLVDSEKVIRTGGGKRGDPYRYRVIEGERGFLSNYGVRGQERNSASSGPPS